MDQKVQERIDQIESEIREIDEQIAQLRLRREAVLMSDEEYAGYIEHYQMYYDDDPLPIRAYYQRMSELEAINAEWNKPGVDYEALWSKHRKQIQELERVLAA